MRMITGKVGIVGLRELMRGIDYREAGILLCSGTFGSHWLPRRWNSTLFGNLWEPLVTPKMEFYSVREPLGAIGYPEDGILLCSGTKDRV
ncbi:hypothetical protein BLX88_03330 [Bacillus obstructivus]|nr:hypothetical protein BLX88_03330 [Bacillus obstructivus]